MYDIFYTDSVRKFLKKLENYEQVRIVSTLERCRLRPHSFVSKLVGKDYYKLRVGDYRVIMSIFEGKLQILVIEIGHRKNIYN